MIHETELGYFPCLKNMFWLKKGDGLIICSILHRFGFQSHASMKISFGKVKRWKRLLISSVYSPFYKFIAVTNKILVVLAKHNIIIVLAQLWSLRWWQDKWVGFYIPWKLPRSQNCLCKYLEIRALLIGKIKLKSIQSRPNTKLVMNSNQSF